MTVAPIDVQSLGRRFGARVALDAVDLELEPGEIFGLVGPNGSGKTTLLRLIAGFLRPHAGSVEVYGLDPFAQQARVMEHVRFAFAPPALLARLTAREHLRFLSALHRSSPAPSRSRDIEEVLDWVGLRERADEPVEAFSFGMRQRLILGQALLPLPRLIVLDEPTDGLDPIAVLELRAILSRLRDEAGLTVLLSNHLMIEIEELVDRMLVLIEGKAVYVGTPAGMVKDRCSTRLRVRDTPAGVELLRKKGLQPREIGGELELPSGELSLKEAFELFQAEGCELISFRQHAPSLEEALIGRLRSYTQAEGASP